MNVCTDGVMQLVPFMNSLVSEDAFFNGGNFLQDPVVHVLGKDGVLYRYNEFSLGRSSLHKVGDTPVKLGASKLKPYLNPLVNNQKIPVQMLWDILEFFKKVMAMVPPGGNGHGDYEAMAHIVWNKTTQSYRVAIPTQQVSKARVSYDWSHVKEDEEVILDIHSHNSMDAFFSSTDENDDKTYAGISGVAGRLDTNSPKVIWRFNAYKDKVPNLNMEDFFAMPEKSASPEVDDWMGKVQIQRYTPPVTPKYDYRNPTGKGSRVFGGGSYAGGGSGKLDQFEEEAAEGIADWNARFQGQDAEGFSASTGAARSEALDFLDPEFGRSNLLSLGLNPDMTWDETADELVSQVYSEEDDELNAAVAKRLAESVVDNEVLFQEGIFVVTTASEARKVVERLNKDFNIRSA